MADVDWPVGIGQGAGNQDFAGFRIHVLMRKLSGVGHEIAEIFNYFTGSADLETGEQRFRVGLYRCLPDAVGERIREKTN